MYPQDSDKIKLLSSIILLLALLVFLYSFIYNAQKSKGNCMRYHISITSSFIKNKTTDISRKRFS